jgi:hypothetical protein
MSVSKASVLLPRAYIIVQGRISSTLTRIGGPMYRKNTVSALDISYPPKALAITAAVCMVAAVTGHEQICGCLIHGEKGLSCPGF